MAARIRVAARSTQAKHRDTHSEHAPHKRSTDSLPRNALSRLSKSLVPDYGTPSWHWAHPRAGFKRFQCHVRNGKKTAPTLIVQHMPTACVPRFAERLDRLSPAHVKMAIDDVLARGMVHVVPGHDRHMCIASSMEDKISLLRNPPIAGDIPWADVLFQFFLPLQSRARYAILATMGADWTGKRAQVRKAGGGPVARSPENCIVFVMPKERIHHGGGEAVLALEQIAYWLPQALTDVRS